MVARSFKRVWKLWTGSPLAVRFLRAFPSAAGDRLAGETTYSLRLSATSGSSSSKSMGAKARRMCHST